LTAVEGKKTIFSKEEKNSHANFSSCVFWRMNFFDKSLIEKWKKWFFYIWELSNCWNSHLSSVRVSVWPQNDHVQRSVVHHQKLRPKAVFEKRFWTESNIDIKHEIFSNLKAFPYAIDSTDCCFLNRLYSILKEALTQSEVFWDWKM
jgi:hypothetical protein